MALKRTVRRRLAMAGLIAVPLGAAIAVPLTQTSAAGAAIPAAAISHVQAVAKWWAKESGDPSPVQMTVVATTHARALSSATPADTTPYVPADTPVYLVLMKGHFTAPGGMAPQGARPPTGTYLYLIIDARKYGVMDLGLRLKPSPVSPASLGHVISLKP